MQEKSKAMNDTKITKLGRDVEITGNLNTLKRHRYSNTDGNAFSKRTIALYTS